MNTPVSLIDLLKEIADSDMAMREEDEGRTSPLLEKVRAAIARGVGERESVAPKEGFNSPPPLQSLSNDPPIPFPTLKERLACWLSNRFGKYSTFADWGTEADEIIEIVQQQRTPDMVPQPLGGPCPQCGIMLDNGTKHQCPFVLRSEISEHKLPDGWCTLGVGNGRGNLFVHGDYESIKACQQLILSGNAPVTVTIADEAIKPTIDIEAAIREMEGLLQDDGTFGLSQNGVGRNDGIAECINILRRIAGEKEGV